MKSAKSFFFIDHKNPDGLDEIRSQKVGENTRALYHSRNKEMHSNLLTLLLWSNLRRKMSFMKCNNARYTRNQLNHFITFFSNFKIQFGH